MPVAAQPKSPQSGQAVPQTSGSRRRRTAAPGTPVAASGATPQAQAQIPSSLPAESADAETKELVLPEKLPVIMLLDLVGKHLDLSYVYNPEDVKGEVSLKLNGDLRGKIKVKDLYPLLEQTLQAEQPGHDPAQGQHRDDCAREPERWRSIRVLVDGASPARGDRRYGRHRASSSSSTSTRRRPRICSRA